MTETSRIIKHKGFKITQISDREMGIMGRLRICDNCGVIPKFGASFYIMPAQGINGEIVCEKCYQEWAKRDFPKKDYNFRENFIIEYMKRKTFPVSLDDEFAEQYRQECGYSKSFLISDLNTMIDKDLIIKRSTAGCYMPRVSGAGARRPRFVFSLNHDKL
ncbi:hypothetical protein ACPF04_05745 [Campylobacter sp. MOP51]|uniref:hypothetical protein n=1 Tax=Campylobacter canis TaxID=3378588 RepID=UPI003C63A919